MRKVLFLALMIAAMLPVAGSRPATGCTDWDEDGVCATADCNDSNPTIGYNGDGDGDGVTICQGDCDDGDAANVDKCMGAVFQMYPVIYNPPEQPCSQGYTVTTKYYNCEFTTWIMECNPNCHLVGAGLACAAAPYYQVSVPYLRNC
jgi:hypothetical protein